jgi:uncharacterized protein (DUF2235 family)
MLAKCGLLHPEQDNLVRYATRLYNEQGNAEAAAGFAENYGRPCPVHCIGVWDTVASLGYLYANRRFFNARLGPDVAHAYHALAIDERRPKFEPLPWEEHRVHDHQTLEQVWFPGAHADVGGGYAERGLAEISLQWMLDRARAVGLEIDDAAEPPQPAEPVGTMHRPWNIRKGLAVGFLCGGNRPREIGPQGPYIHRHRLTHRPD